MDLFQNLSDKQIEAVKTIDEGIYYSILKGGNA